MTKPWIMKHYLTLIGVFLIGYTFGQVKTVSTVGAMQEIPTTYFKINRTQLKLNLNGQSFETLQMIDSDISGTSFKNTEIQLAQFTGSNINRCNFKGTTGQADFTGVSFKKVRLKNCQFESILCDDNFLANLSSKDRYYLSLHYTEMGTGLNENGTNSIFLLKNEATKEPWMTE